MVLEALTFKKYREDREAKQKHEHEEFMKGKQGLTFDELDELVN